MVAEQRSVESSISMSVMTASKVLVAADTSWSRTDGQSGVERLGAASFTSSVDPSIANPVPGGLRHIVKRRDLTQTQRGVCKGQKRMDRNFMIITSSSDVVLIHPNHTRAVPGSDDGLVLPPPLLLYQRITDSPLLGRPQGNGACFLIAVPSVWPDIQEQVRVRLRS